MPGAAENLDNPVSALETGLFGSNNPVSKAETGLLQ
jgi:hypothetical protein